MIFCHIQLCLDHIVQDQILPSIFPQLTEQLWFELRWNYPMQLKYRGKKEKFPVSLALEQRQIYLWEGFIKAGLR